MLFNARHTIVFLFTALLCRSAMGQSERLIRVLSEEKGTPVPAVELTIDFRPEGPYYSGKTNAAGEFIFTQTGAFKLVVFDAGDTLKGSESVHTGKETEIVVKLKTNDPTIDPVTIIGNMVRPVSKNPYYVRVIGKEKIARMAAQNLSDVLLNETNIQLGQDQVLGTSAIMQGIGGQDIKILVNGIPLLGRVNGNIDVSQIPVSNIERIEIIEGPMSVIYGTDALGGIINIVTRNPSGGKFTGRVNYYMDNLQNYNVDAAVNTRITKHTPLMFNFGRYFFTGRDFNPLTRVYDWKPKTKYFADGSVFFHGSNSTHRITSSWYNEKLTDRSEAEYNLTTITGFNSFYYTTRFDNSMHSVFKLDKHAKFEMQNAFNYYIRSKNTIKRDLVTGNEEPYRPEDQDTTQFTLMNSRGVFSHYNPGEDFNFIAGYDFSQEKGYGKRIPADRPGISDIAIFGSSEFIFNKELEIRPSMRLLYNSRFGKPAFSNLFGDRFKLAPIIPSLQIKYNMSEHLAFRGSYSKGFRAPSLKELNFYFVDVNHNIHGNDSLKAETSDNFILSFDYRHKLKGGKGTMFGFSLFNNIIKNKINLALVDARTNYFTYINIGRFRSQGLNINFEFFTPRFSWGMSSSLINVFDLLVTEDSINQKYYINGQLSFNFSYKIPRYNLAFSLFSRYTSPTNGYTQNSYRYKIDGYYLMDLSVQKSFKQLPFQVKFKWRKKQVDRTFNLMPINLNFGCKNILGITSVNSSRVVSSNPHSQDGFNVNITPGRTFFVQLNYSFHNIQ